MAEFTTKMTKRDAFLLVALVVTVVLFVFVKYMFLPAIDGLTSLDDEITAADEERFVMQSSVLSLEQLKESTEKKQEELNALIATFTSEMKAYEVDAMMTNMIEAGGLSCVSLSFPDKEQASVKKYLENDKSATSEIISSYKVSLKAEGTPDEVYAFIDRVLALSPGMRVVSYSTEVHGNITTLTMGIEIYMASNAEVSR